ncbi:MAG: hypothetical protein ABGZ17_11990 [Planctomycetaceae bacterium]
MVWMQGLLVFLAWAEDGGESHLRITSVGDATRIVVSARLGTSVWADRPHGPIPQKLAQRWLQLVVLRDDGTSGQPIFARYQWHGRRLTCVPQFALEHGRVYRAVLLQPGQPAVTQDYRVPPGKPVPQTQVARIFPSTSVLPANHLKFYVHFSQPMREGKAMFDHMSLVDQRGQSVEDPWRRTELWSADGRRLTLWIHPGRVKRGLNLREQMGPVLHPGTSYTLVIGRGVKDQYNRPLQQEYRRTFRVVAADHRRPLPRRWKIDPPRVESRDVLQVRFGEALDQPLLLRFLRVIDGRGRPVPGVAAATDQESGWQFTPQRPWTLDNYRLTVNPLLEDLAGNTPLRVFDTDLDQPEPSQPRLWIDFQPRETSRGQGTPVR